MRRHNRLRIDLLIVNRKRTVVALVVLDMGRRSVSYLLGSTFYASSIFSRREAVAPTMLAPGPAEKNMTRGPVW